MRKFRFSRFKYHVGVSGLVLLLWMRPAWSSTLSLECALGFNGRFQINTWVPITVTIENRGKAVTGTLEVLVTSGSEYHRNVYQASYSLDMDLPYGSTKQCSFTVFIESYTHDLIVRFQMKEKTMVSQSINLKTLYAEKALAGILIDGIYPEILPALPDNLLPVHLHERFLPQAWYGYDGVMLIVMEAEKVNRLRTPQLKALERWLRQGGFLVISGSVNAGVLMDRGMQHLLPITVHGLKKVNQLKILFDFSGLQIADPDPALVLDVGIAGSDVLAKSGNIPLVAARELGNGRIVFLSFDPLMPPFAGLLSHSGFWRRILSMSPKRDPKPIVPSDQRILQVMLNSVNMRFPNFWLTGLSVILYLICYWVCVKKMDNNKWPSVRYLFLTVFCFSIAGIGYLFFSSQKGASYNSFCRIRLTDRNAHSEGEYFLGLYSIGEEPYDVSFTDSPMPVRHLLSENATRKTPSPYHIQQVGLHNHIKGLSEAWSYSFYVGRHRLEFPALAAVKAAGEHLNVVIENQTPYAVVDCLIFYDQRIYKMNDIPSNSKASRKIVRTILDGRKPDAPGGRKPISVSGFRSPWTFFQTMRNKLKDDLFSAVHETADTGKNMLYITGWITSDVLNPNFAQKNITGEGIAFISWKIEL